MTDKQIQQLIKDAKITVSPDFTDRVFASIAKTKELENKIDVRCDELLRDAKIKASPTFTSKAIQRITYKNTSTAFEIISKVLIFAATAVCLSLVVGQLNVPYNYVISESDFAEISNLDSEISNLAHLIYEQEFIDVLLK
ncbi:MAG: hypothetical protein J6B07_06305 [Opitutales bacterium]|nr:hypothetical protein [Opitutales bacterium]